MASLQQMAKSMRKATFETTPQWTLGQLIEELASIAADDDCWVSFAFGNFVPTDCDSWRGSYDEIAIGYTVLERCENRPMLTDFLQHLRECVGKEFTGYKGGQYVMNESTPVWVANYGNSGSCGVVGLHVATGANGNAYCVWIRTDYCEF
jgi:hypothetical protein